MPHHPPDTLATMRREALRAELRAIGARRLALQGESPYPPSERDIRHGREVRRLNDRAYELARMLLEVPA